MSSYVHQTDFRVKLSDSEEHFRVRLCKHDVKLARHYQLLLNALESHSQKIIKGEFTTISVDDFSINIRENNDRSIPVDFILEVVHFKRPESLIDVQASKKRKLDDRDGVRSKDLRRSMEKLNIQSALSMPAPKFPLSNMPAKRNERSFSMIDLHQASTSTPTRSQQRSVRPQSMVVDDARSSVLSSANALAASLTTDRRCSARLRSTHTGTHVKESADVQADAKKAAKPVEDIVERFAANQNKVSFESVVKKYVSHLEAQYKKVKEYFLDHNDDSRPWSDEYGAKLDQRNQILDNFFKVVSTVVFILIFCI